MTPVPASTLVDLSASATLGGDWLAVVRAATTSSTAPGGPQRASAAPAACCRRSRQGTWD
ncbi:MAG: hypothetical protein HS111_01020 [Kofleriaceae bacterium]|nr:hypothetical protein [Kofleriaceae bacterium]